MRRLRDISINGKLKVITMGTSSVALLVACAAFVTYDVIVTRQSMASDLATLAKVIGANCTAALAFGDSDSAKDVLSALSAKQPVVRARLFFPDATVFAEYLRDVRPEPEMPELEKPVVGSRFEGGYLIACEPVVLDGETIGTLCVESDLEVLSQGVREDARIVAIVLFGSLLVALVISTRLQGLISGPISHLAKTARAVTVEKDYNIRAVKTSGDELGMLIDGFNEMLTQIQGRDVELQNARDRLEGRVEERTAQLQQEVSERKQAEKTLRESEALFRSLAESVSAAIYIYRDGRYVYLNPAAELISGYTRDELMGMQVWDIVHPDFREQMKALAALRLEDERVSSRSEIKIITKSGKPRWVELTANLIRFQGEPALLATAFDTTERRGWEDALRESEEKYRTILESIQEGYYEVDLRGGLTFFNDSLSRIMGTPAEKMRGLNYRGYTVPETAARVREAFEHVFRTGETLEGFQYEILTLEGVRRFLETTVSVRRDSTGEIVGFRGTSRDITGRKQSEEALQESEQRYRLLFESNPQPMWVYDLETLSFLAVNEAAIHNYGYSRSEYLSMTIRDIRPPEDVALMLESISRDGDSSLFRPTNWRHQKKDGTIIEVEKTSHTLMFTGRRARLVLATDITERRKIEKEVMMLAHAMRSVNEFIVVTDLEGKITFLNDAAIKGYGYEREEAMGRNVSVLHSLGTSPAVVEDIVSSAGSTGWEGELLCRRKDGTEFPVHLSASEIQDESGRGVALVGVSQDITDRKRAIDELRKAKEAAESASRAKSEFLANMSHEIRTPMNGIIGMTELALDTDLSGEQREYLGMVKTSANSLLTVINDILDFSKIEAGKLELDASEFSLRDGVAEATRPLAMRAHQKKLELVIQISPDVPDWLVGDPGRLRQVMINLVGNAIKFTEVGEIVISVEKKWESDDCVWLHFSVSDTGIGIPPEKQDLIFRPFTQADGSTSRKYGGTGLGLAISTRFVEMMGGEMWIESKPGDGSTFHFTAQFGLAKDPTPANIPVHPANLWKLRVLIVDDNATNRRILEQVLTHWNMKPSAVDGGEAALSILKHAAQAGKPFPLVLLDSQMPGMDGFSVAARIKETRELAGTTIMMLTSNNQRNDAARCRELGVAAFLIKPVMQSNLFNAILTAMGAPAPTDEPGSTAAQTSEARGRESLHILLAEDNAINQRLARELLEKRGHTVVVAENGRKALAAFQGELFDVVLMDVQMPELNGFEVTAAIRETERVTGAHVPIIAMTAHALKGDRERCIEAGMDDYVSKPIRLSELTNAIEKLVGVSATCQEAEVAQGSAEEVFDAAALLARVDGDADLLRHLVNLFLEELPRLLGEVRNAVAGSDSEALERAAHTLRGSVGNFHAGGMVEAAQRLEALGREANLAAAQEAVADLEQEVERLKPALIRLGKEQLVYEGLDR